MMNNELFESIINAGTYREQRRLSREKKLQLKQQFDSWAADNMVCADVVGYTIDGLKVWALSMRYVDDIVEYWRSQGFRVISNGQNLQIYVDETKRGNID